MGVSRPIIRGMSDMDSSLQQSIVSEYEALSERGAGHGVVFEVKERALLELTGKDRASFLHNFCSNDIKGLQPGRGCEAFLTNIKGRILEHLFVFADADSLWVDGTPGHEEAVSTHLDRYLITEDVQIHRRSAERRTLWVVGAGATGWLQDVAGSEPLPAEHLRHRWIETGNGERVHCRRFDLGGFPGWQVSGPISAIEAIARSGQEAGARSGSGELLEALRIESGLPRYGVDITDDHLAQECRRTAAAISFTKGCYLGQEPIARIDALGHVNRELAVLEGKNPETPDSEVAVGTVILGPDGTPSGTLTSFAWHPRTRSHWGMAVLKRTASAEGTQVAAGAGQIPFIVHSPLAADRR